MQEQLTKYEAKKVLRQARETLRTARNKQEREEVNALINATVVLLRKLEVVR